MTTAIKRRRGTTAQHATFTGLEGELTVDTTKDTVVVHDGATAGGFPLAKESQATTNVAITGGTISGITDLAVADGGTGASTAGDARTNLGVTATGADTTYAYRANNLSDLASASTARTNLGLGTAATTASTDYATAAQGTKADNALTAANPSYTGTLTGGTGVVNLGSGQFYKDASGNVGIGTTSPSYKLDVFGSSGVGIRLLETSTGNNNRLVISQSGTSTIYNSTYASGSANHVWQIADTERMRIDSSGNVGIGTASPIGNNSLTTFAANGANVNGVYSIVSGVMSTFVGCNNTGGVVRGVTNGTAGFGTADSVPLTFGTVNIERMRIDAGGNLLIGKTVADTTNAGAYFESNTINYGRLNFVKATASGTGATAALAFYYNNTQVGTVTNTSTATAYNTSSDYRLKENIAPMQGALNVVQQLKPVTYTWKADGSDGQGFIAHELQAVVPDCVTGEKDAVDEDGKPVYQGIDTSFLVATLTAAIQELKAELDATKAEVALLKAAA